MAKFAAVIIFIAIVISSTPVFAQTSTATSTPQTIKDRLRTIKEERQAFVAETREQVKEKMEAFRAQIKTIRDERKQILTERIADKIASSNARLTNRMDKALDHLTDILNRVKNRAADFKAQGKDTTALDQAISAAEAAIAEAKNAVEAQGAKEYTANITDESTLRNTIGQMVSGFRLDIQAVHKLVIAAKQAVQKAIMEAAKLRGEDNTATDSANI
ncbi:MAG: hypothetical protein A2868_00175 [Candidatus Levybacteria bacterium RIFCSPHIGHO2_01_FULL_40_15b]|nr:MAG: hypothetical protein A2868_00175 [Candidatus Levybacteria bacterium RIFCSPHIGHO2_01_FULL_40_15b]